MRRFPLGLTVSALLAFSVLAGLGAWQLQRMTWKAGVLARVEAARHATARPLAEVLLASTSAVDDLEYRRVEVRCEPSAASAAAYRYALREGGEINWRLLTTCRLATGPYDAILLDRGLVSRFAGAMAPQAGLYPPPSEVTGVLRGVGAKPWLGPAETSPNGGPRVFRLIDRASLDSLLHQAGARRPAPYFLAVEHEEPSPAGVVPAALPQDIPNNHFAYALTWFALAGILAWFYGALLIRRLGSQ